jgi:hypothetical protein
MPTRDIIKHYLSSQLYWRKSTSATDSVGSVLQADHLLAAIAGSLVAVLHLAPQIEINFRRKHEGMLGLLMSVSHSCGFKTLVETFWAII